MCFLSQKLCQKSVCRFTQISSARKVPIQSWHVLQVSNHFKTLAFQHHFRKNNPNQMQHKLLFACRFLSFWVAGAPPPHPVPPLHILPISTPVFYTYLRAHDSGRNLLTRLLFEQNHINLFLSFMPII